MIGDFELESAVTEVGILARFRTHQQESTKAERTKTYTPEPDTVHQSRFRPHFDRQMKMEYLLDPINNERSFQSANEETTHPSEAN